MNKTLKRRVFRHTALYAAILMFSHTGGGGAMAQTYKYAIIMNEGNQLEVKGNGQYSTIKDKDREREYTYHQGRGGGGGSVSFNNSDELVSRQSGTAVFGTATYLPPYGKVSGFDERKLKERTNALNWIHTTHPGLIGYSYAGVVCRDSTGCPKLVYKTQFTFGNSGLAKKANGGGLDIYVDKSRDNSPIYKLKDHPWLGVSFNLGSENTVKNSKSSNKLISSFSEDNNNQTIVSTTEGSPISLGDQQREHTAVVYYLNAKLHLLDKKQIQNITDKTVQLGVLKPSIDVRQQKGANWLSFWASWDIKDTGQIPVKLGLQQVKAGRCINKPNPNPNKKDLSPALTAPALWFGPVKDGKAEMYSASVSTYPDSSSSRIFLQNLERKTDPGRPGRHSLKPLSDTQIKSREPNFTGRQTIIRLDGRVQQIKLGQSNNEVVGFNGNSNNATFGIVSEGSFTPDASEWKKVLLPWTVRVFADDSKFKEFNKEEKDNKPKYSQKYRSRDNGKRERNLGDIVNSPIVAVGEYLATSANDGMVHIFKKNGGGDDRNYSLKLSYIPGTMPRKDIESKDSNLAKELRAFAEKGYVGDRYGVDGGFVLRQVEWKGQNRVFMFGAMGFGGRGAYALDLTKADDNDPTKASLFDVKDNGNNGNNGNNGVQLGYTVGTPQIGKTHDGKYAAFLASGYATKDINNGENKTALYVYDLESNNGTLIRKIEVPNGKGGLSSPTLVDKDLDGTIDIAYAGDRSGKMYRFDLSSQSPDQWTVRPIFEGTKPITSAPAISQLKDKRVVIFGTGSDLSE
ncbi:PilC family type IV pilus tip adhesin, partial [Neisseria meningitidis]|uniref:PilC family type IV pilus tip adhesin n=1 Tax=Neisseria meningitidis TaxID=487 RepID=UPI0021F1CF93